MQSRDAYEFIELIRHPPASSGPDTLLILDEAWVFLDDPLFAAPIRE